MKTILLSITALFIGVAAYAQNCVADFSITNVGNSFTFNFTGNQPTNASIYWNIAGQNYTGTTVTATIPGPSMDFVSCQVTLIDSVNNLFCSDSKLDTLFIPGSTNNYCMADFDLLQDSTSINDYYLINQSTYSSNLQYVMWDFGDGTATNDPYPSHNYANVGTYVISLFIYTDSCWSIATDTLEVTSKSTGTWVYVIDEASLATQAVGNFVELKLYPNPSKGIDMNLSFSAQVASDIQVSIYSVTGSSVHNQTLTSKIGRNDLRLPTHQLSKGMYFVEITDFKGNKETLRFVVE
ncbi:Por secretion system C-terminal sorting domain-containing protein [Lishizhenia tianjinensis]|uniref:Por secretion system C-terminal sorting domain-containing protein n=1 Tax=Lishizhenia tianjinensis TaxID=477690 RepID=A0A1I6Y5I9_9FLAO|nr:T9SS type A sorting domain-containing protein [Lishizhenia tianjinensis]SFT45740.1 Por secretion system C-terminal sorting domain-containing protein [Lishizhenia tianjinensis]